MIAEIDALDHHRRTMDEGPVGAMHGHAGVGGASSSSPSSRVGPDGWGAWDRPAVRSEAQRKQSAAALRRWVRLQMRADRAAAALAEYEFPE